jgi:GDPmannose 4,6-dehydratase
MWMTLQPKEPENYVIATGESHSIRELLEEAFSYAGLDYRKYVETDPAFLRTVEIAEMRGDSAKAREILGWKPSVSFRQLVRLLVDAELKTLGLAPPVAG